MVYFVYPAYLVLLPSTHLPLIVRLAEWLFVNSTLKHLLPNQTAGILQALPGTPFCFNRPAKLLHKGEGAVVNSDLQLFTGWKE